MRHPRTILAWPAKSTLILTLVMNLHSAVISDFNNGIPDWDFIETRNGTPAINEVNGQLIMELQLPATNGDLGNSLTAAGWLIDLPLLAGQTLETRVKVVSTSREDVMAGFELQSGDQNALYSFLADEKGVYFGKVSWATGVKVNHFIHTLTPIKLHNSILSLAQTRLGDTVLLTVKILDDEVDQAVLFEQSLKDTPDVDPSTFPVPGLPSIGPDSGPPVLNISIAYLHMAQITDGMQPAAEVVYDDFSYQYLPYVLVQAERDVDNHALVLSWPPTDLPFLVEESPHPDGPWTFHEELPEVTPLRNSLSIPMAEPNQFFRLRSYQPLSITRQPQSQRVAPGDLATFAVAAIGERNIRYQWYYNEAMIEGATGAQWVIPEVQRSDEGNYTVVVTDALGSVTSETATLTVLIPPTIVAHPQSRTFRAGETVTFSVTVTNTANLPVGYRWRFGSATVDHQVLDAHTCTFTIPSATLEDAGNYSVVVTNTAFSTPGFLSSPATLTVEP